jgi:hypothetical protein
MPTEIELLAPDADGLVFAFVRDRSEHGHREVVER